MTKTPLGSIAIVAAAVLLALLTGLLIPVAGLLVVAALWAVPAGLTIVFYPQIFYWLMLVLVLVVSGTVQYFADISQLQWIASGIGICLLISGLLRGASGSNQGPGRMTAIDFCLLVFTTTAVVSTALGGGGAAHLAVGLRNYLPFLGLYAFVRFGVVQGATLRRTIWFFFWVAVLQWPMELYQALVVVPQRVAAAYFGSSWDSVVGTFGGPKFGGGASGSLAVFLLFALALVLAMWRNKVLSQAAALVSFLAIMVGFALAEAKVVFVLLPVALGFLYSDEMKRRPMRFLLGAMLTAGLLVLLLYFYFVFFWESQTKGSVYDAIVRRFAYSFDPNFMATSSWPGRMTGLAIWLRGQDFLGDPYHWLLGYGVAAATSVSSIAGPGVAALKFGLGTDVTGATKLLWEVGLLGLVAYLAPLFLAFNVFGRALATETLDPLTRAFVQALRASTAVLFLAVLYEVTIVSSPPLQLLALLLYGFAARLAPTRAVHGVRRFMSQPTRA